MDKLKTFEIVYTDTAIEDIRGKADYIRRKLREPMLANKWYQHLRAEIQDQLTTFPLKYALYDVSPWRERGVRLLITKNDVILYSVDEDQCRVYIRGVCTRGMDLTAHLENTKQ